MPPNLDFFTECLPPALLQSNEGSHIHPTDIESASSLNHTFPAQANFLWVAAAKVGQLARVGGEFKSVSKDAIISSLGTWRNGYIRDNHKTLRAGVQIYDDKFEDPFLYLLLDAQTANDLSSSAGGSIDARATEIIDDRVLKMSGVGYSIISKENPMPACTKDAGCGLIAAATTRKAALDTTWDFKAADYTQDELESACAWVNPAKPKDGHTKEDCKLPYKLPDGTIVWAGVHSAMGALNGARDGVNIPKSAKESVYKVLKVAYELFDKQPPELKANIKEESKGGDRIMADEVDKKAEVLYTIAQTKERITAAVTEAIENNDNAHKVELADIDKGHTDKLTEIADTHTTELKEQKTKMFELASLIETAKTKYGLDDEKVKILQDAKTPEDILRCFSELEIKKEEAVAASVEGAEESDTGVVVASTTAQVDTITKIEEVGSYDPYKKEWVPSFREEIE